MRLATLGVRAIFCVMTRDCGSGGGFPRWVRSIAAAALIGLSADVSGQDESKDAGSARPEFSFSVNFSSVAGAYTYVPQKWGELRLRLVNAQSEPLDLICATSFDQDPKVQYGRRIWLPAQAALRIAHPILIPPCEPAKGNGIKLQSLVLDVGSGEEVLVKNEEGLNRHTGNLLVTHQTRNTGVIAPTSIMLDTPEAEIADLVVACRIDERINNRFTLLTDEFLAPDDTSLNYLDQIVVADNRIVEDFAALAALRQWLHAGGHLWIMLDRVDPVVLELLLGDGFHGHVVDRLSLSSVRIEQASVSPDGEAANSVAKKYDDPVEFVRLAVSDFNVTQSINGWPAAMTRACGSGLLLITTLGPRGWMEPAPESTMTAKDHSKIARFTTSNSLHSVLQEFFQIREPELLPPSAIEPQVGEYIGYSILSGWLIGGTLLVFSASIVAIGIWLMRVGRLEHVSWVGSVLAVAVSAMLIVAGRQNRHAVPATMASVQLLQATRGTDDLHSTGLVSIYQPEGSNFPITATRGGRLSLDMTGLEETSRRMVTSDLGVYEWQNLRQAAGVRVSSFEQSETVDQRLMGHVTLNGTGVSGTYAGQIPPGEDAILATRTGRLGLTLQRDGTFAGRADDVFSRDQFLRAGIVSDEQNRRRLTLKALLTNPKRHDYPEQPQLMFWSQPWDNGFRFGEGLSKQGATLVAVPLVIDRPPNGTEILIPAPLMSYINRLNPDGSPPSGMWDPNRQNWQERSKPGTNWLNFQIPTELLPLAAERARINVQVAGPVGRMEILGLKQGEVIPLGTTIDPVGSISYEITDSDCLTIDGKGNLALGISAGDPARPELTLDSSGKVSYWRIESLALQLWARTIEPIVKE